MMNTAEWTRLSCVPAQFPALSCLVCLSALTCSGLKTFPLFCLNSASSASTDQRRDPPERRLSRVSSRRGAIHRREGSRESAAASRARCRSRRRRHALSRAIAHVFVERKLGAHAP
eukprot:6183493-Pleurochrysis_carterae.AAC.6